MNETLDRIPSAWKGHLPFATWLVKTTQPDVIVDLGVDYGYSTFVFQQQLEKNDKGTVYGIDLFLGDDFTGQRNTEQHVRSVIQDQKLKHIEILRGDFTSFSKIWTLPINILHIDGFHTFEAVKNDFDCWYPHLKPSGIVLFHDVEVPQFGVRKFFDSLKGGYKGSFQHSAGLGIWTRNQQLYNTIWGMWSNFRCEE